MKRNELKTKAASIAFMFLIFLVMGITSSATAQAQYRQDDSRYDRDDRDRWNNRRRWDNNRTREYAYAFAYYIAYPEGREIAYRKYRTDHGDARAYRNDTAGYMNWMGDSNTYRSNYRRGFEQGWKDGVSGRNNRFDRRDVERLLGDSLRNVYGHNWNNRDGNYGDRDRYDRDQIIRIAQQNGYREGHRHGDDDRNRRRGYDYDDSSNYLNALEGYRSEYGDREFYRRAYREGYKRGYDDAYRRNSGWGGRGNG